MTPHFCNKKKTDAMKVYENHAARFRKDVRAKRLVNFLCAEYEAASGKAVTGELRYAWKYALTTLCGILEGSGSLLNPEAGIRIDLEERAGASHMKLIFASLTEGILRYSLLGVYAGSGVKLTRAEDIVSFREGNTRWTSIHPSLAMHSFSRRLFRGIPEEELQSVSYESASFLFDCFYSCDSDIITDYDDQLTDEYPVFYANDTEELLHFLEPVITGGGGIEALRKLSAIEIRSFSLSPKDRSEDQIYLFSSITNNVRRGRKAWYVIDGQIGEGDIVMSVMEKLESEGRNVQILSGGERPDGEIDLIVISGEDGGTLDQLSLCKVSIFVCDLLQDMGLKGLENDAVLTARAEEEGAQLTITRTNRDASFADGGRGMRWLVNRLQLAKIRREDYDPNLYEVLLAGSREEFDEMKRDGMAHVLLPANIAYDPESGRISFQKNQKKGIYKAISSGRRGAVILSENAALKDYLREEISHLIRRRKWIESFVSEMAEGKKDPEKQMDDLAKKSGNIIKEADSRYQKKAGKSLGKSAWNKMSDESRTWIVTAMMAYDSMKEYDRMIDFSGICVQIGKACEYELKKRIFKGFVEYEMTNYGSGAGLKKLPAECFEKQDKKENGPKKLLKENQITLGKLRYIIGLDDSGRVANTNAWNEFKRYAEEKLLTDPAHSYKVMRAQMPVIAKIRDDYRNRSAHSHTISIVEARECLEYVVTVQRKLGELLDEYRA